MARDPAAERMINDYWASQQATQKSEQDAAIQRVLELQKSERERVDANNAAIAAQNRAQQEEQARRNAAASKFVTANQAAAAAARTKTRPQPKTQAQSNASYAQILARSAATQKQQEAIEAQENAQMSAAIGAWPSFKDLTGFETEQQAISKATSGINEQAIGFDKSTGRINVRPLDQYQSAIGGRSAQYLEQEAPGGVKGHYQQTVAPQLQQSIQSWESTPEGQKFTAGYNKYQQQLAQQQAKRNEFTQQQGVLMRAAQAAQKARQKANGSPTPSKFAKGGEVKASRGDGCAQRGKTKGKMR